MSIEQVNAHDLEVQKYLAEISRLLALGKDGDEVWPQVARLVKQLLDYDRVVISILDKTRNTVVDAYTSGLEIRNSNNHVVHGDDPTSLASRLGESLATFHPSTDELHDMSRSSADESRRWAAGLRSIIAVPLIWRQNLVGIISLRSTKPNAYDFAQGKIAELLGAQIAGSVAALSSFRQSQRQLLERSATARIGQTLASSRSMIELGETIGPQIRKLFDCNYVGITVREKNSDSYRVEFVDSDRPIPGLNVGDIKRTEGSAFAVVVAERAAASISPNNHEEWLKKAPGLQGPFDAGLTRGVIAPLITDDQVFGTLTIAGANETQYLDAEVKLMQVIADQISPIIQNLQLRLDLQAQLEREKAVANISAAVNSYLDIESIFESLGTEISSIIPYDRLIIRSSQKAWAPFRRGRFANVSSIGAAPELAWDSSTNHSLVEDITADATHPIDQVSYKDGIRSRIRKTFGSVENRLGFISLSSVNENAYSAEDANLLDQISDVVTPAIHNAREHQLIEQLAQEQETLTDIAGIVSTGSDFNTILIRVAQRFQQYGGIDEFYLTGLDDELGTFSDIMVADLDSKPRVEITEFKELRESTITTLVRKSNDVIRATVLPHGNPALNPVVVTDENPRGIRSTIGAPMVADGKTIGAVVVRSKIDGDFANLSDNVMRRLAEQLASAFLLDELNRNVQEDLAAQSALAEISRIIASSETIDAVFNEIGDVVASILPCDRMFISTSFGNDKTAVVRHNWGFSTPDVDQGTIYKIEDSQLGEILKTGLTLRLGEHNIDEYAKHIPRLRSDLQNGLRSQVTVPLVFDGLVIGIFGVRSHLNDAYTNRDVRIADLIASQISGEIEKDELRKSLEESADEDRALADIAKAVSQDLDLDLLYSRLDEALGKVMYFDRLSITSIDKNAVGELRGTVNYSSGLEPEGFDVGAERPSHEVADADDYVLNQAANVPVRDDSLLADILLPLGLRSRIRVSIGTGNERLAILSLLSTEENPYSQRHLDFIGRVSEQIAPAIANAKRYETVARLEAEQRALALIGRSVSQNLDLDQLYQNLAGALTDILDFDRLSIAEVLHTESGETNYQIVYVEGVPAEDYRVGSIRPAWLFDVLEQRGITEIDLNIGIDLPLLKEDRGSHSLTISGLKSRATAMIGVGNRQLALITVSSKNEHQYSQEQLDFISRVCEQVAPAIVNARQYEDTRTLSAEGELIADIGRAVTTSLETDSIFETLASRLSDVVGYDELVINRVDITNGILKDIFASKGSFEHNSLETIPSEGTFAAQVIASGHGLVVNADDYDSLIETNPAIHHSWHRGNRSFLVVPLISNGRMIGTVILRSKTLGQFNDRTMSIVRSIADHIAPAIVADEQSKNRVMLAQIGAAANEYLDINQLYSRVAAELSTVFPYDRLTFSRWHPKESRIDFVAGIEIEHFAVGRSFDSRPYQDLSRDCSSTKILRNPDLLSSYGLSTRIHGLIGPTNHPYAILAMMRKSELGFTSEEENLLQEVVNLIAPSISNAYEHESVVALRDSYEQAQLALDSSSDMIEIHDKDLNFVYVNEAWVEGTGFSREEAIGNSPPLQNPPPPKSQLDDMLSKIMNGEMWSRIYQAHRKNGSSYQEQITVTPVFDSSDEITGFISIKRDITEVLESEAILGQAAAKSALIATVEHEIRSPLAAVMNFVDLLKKSDKAPTDLVDRLKISATELASTVNDLRGIVTGSQSELSLTKTPTDIANILESSADTLGFLAKSKNLNIRFNDLIKPDRVTLNIDAVRIKQVFTNLVGNAVRYSPDRGRIVINLDLTENFARAKIHNTGSGVSESELELITRLFFRGKDSEQSTESGSGIGLAISDAIVKAHGGYMSILSSRNEYFEVEVLLPIAGAE